MAQRFPRGGNPLYPLPFDYEQLSGEGQRMARVNAVSLQETPEDLVHAWAFFRRYYLSPRRAHWYKRLKPSPPAHYQMVRDIGRMLAGEFPACAWAAPRGFAKSTVLNEIILLLALTRSAFSTSIIRATDRKSRKNLAAMQRQLENNPYILEDFGPQKPPRGSRPWSTEMLELPNHSTIEGLSIGGALRGDRPDLVVIDDPEYDEDAEGGEKTQRLVEDFERLLFQTIFGMLEEGGSGLFWIGTLLHRRSFLWHIQHGDDPRFACWMRRTLAVIAEDGSLLWPAKWSPERIADLRAQRGESAFAAEYLNRPGSGRQRILSLHPRLDMYRVEDGSPHRDQRPLNSPAILTYDEGHPEDGETNFRPVRCLFGEWASRLYRLSLVDYAPTVSSASDFSCVLVLGFDRMDWLWVLDGFLGKVGTDQLSRTIFDLSYRWQVKVIGVEAVSLQKHLADRIQFDLAKMAQGTGFIPRVFPIRYPTRASKGERIGGMEWRFNQHRIRFPAHRRNESWVAQLLYQIENFTPDLSLLRWDDGIDTLAMHQYVLRRSGKTGSHVLPIPHFMAEHLKRGELIDRDTGIPWITSAGVQDLTDEAVAGMRKAAQSRSARRQNDLQERNRATWLLAWQKSTRSLGDLAATLP